MFEKPLTMSTIKSVDNNYSHLVRLVTKWW